MTLLIGLTLLACHVGSPATFGQSAAEPAAPSHHDWPDFLGPGRNSKSAETGVLTAWGENGPPLLWHRPLGTSYGIGSVSRGRYLQFDRHGEMGRLTCLDARTGKFLWKFEYPTQYDDRLGYNDGPRCSPVVDGDRIYLFGAEGMLLCVRFDDGRLVWKVDTAGQFGVVQNFFGVGSTPLVEGDLLIVHVGGSPPESHRFGRYDLDRVVGNGSGVVAFDKRSGEVKYQLSDELAAYAAPVAATIGDRRWCFVLARGGLLGFDPTTGKQDFHYPWRARILDSVNASTPIVVGDEVFISECYGPGSSLLKVRPGGYEIVWRDPPTRNKALKLHWNTPIYHEGYLYGSSGRHLSEAELRCVEWKTGKVMWSEPDLTRASLLYVDGRLVCLCEDGVLRLLKATPTKYTEVARAVLRAQVDEVEGEDVGQGPVPLLVPPAWAAPILANGRMYVRGRDRLVCLQLLEAR